MKRPTRIPWAGLLAAAFGAVAAAAQDAAQDDRETDHRYLVHERTTRIDAAGRRTVRIHAVLEILKPSAIDTAGDASVEYNAYYQTARLVRAETRTRDGRTIPVAKNAIHDVVVKPADDCNMYTDARTLSFAMPQVEVGARVDYEIELTDRRATIPGFGWDQVRIDAGVPVERFCYRLEVPASATYTIRTPNLAVEPVVERSGRAVVRTWTLTNVPPMRFEWRMPDPRSLSRAILVSSVPSWDAVRDWYDGLVRGKDRIPDELKARAGELTAGAKTEAEKVQALYTFVQTGIRYVGLELGRSAYEPHEVGETYRFRYGDCKDKSLLLCALLRECGIGASLALVHPWSFEAIATDVPGPAQFNHAIVACEVGGRRLWLDPTVRHLASSSVPRPLQNADALVLGDRGKGLTRIPADGADANLARNVLDIRMDAFGHCIVRDTDELSGDADHGNRLGIEGEDPKEARQQAERFVEGRSAEAKYRGHGHGDPADVSKPFAVWVEYEADDTMVRTEDGFALQLAADGSPVSGAIALWPEGYPADPDEPRRQDWVSSCSEARELVCRLHLPPGFRLGMPVAPRQFTLAQGVLSVRSAEIDQGVEVTIRAERRPARIRAADWREAAAATRRAIAQATAVIVVQDDLRAWLARKQPRQALEAARAASARAPGDPGALRREAQILWACGLHDAARKAWTGAIRLDPSNLAARVELAGSFGFPAEAADGEDALPPAFFDRDAIVRVLGEAVDRATDRPAALRALARAHECDDRGRLFMPEAPYEKAIGIYRGILRDAPDDRLTLLRLGDCLIAAGHYEEAETAFRAVSTRRPGDLGAKVGLWTCAALRGRADEAISMLRSVAGGATADQEMARLVAAAMQRGLYAEAADLIERNAPMSNAGQAARQMAGLMRRMGGRPAQHPRDFLDLATARGAALSLLAAAAAESPAHALRCLSRRIEAGDDDARAAVGLLRMALGASGRDTRFVWDLLRGEFVCTERPLSPEDAEIILTPPSELARSARLTLYATREGDGWRIAGFRPFALGVSWLARVASSYLDEGDQARARPCVDRMVSVAMDARGGGRGESEGETSYPLLKGVLDLPYQDGATRMAAVLAAGIVAPDTAPRALVYARQALKAMPDQLSLAKLAAVAHMLMDDHAGAVAALEPFAAKRVLDRESRALYAQSLAESLRFDEAMAEFRALEEIYSTDPTWSRARIHALLSRGRYEEALREMQANAGRMEPLEAILTEAAIRGNLGQREELAGLRARLDGMPEIQDRARMAMWQAFEMAGDGDRALEQLQCALLANPRSPTALLHLALEWLARGHTAEAETLLAEVGRKDDRPRLTAEQRRSLAELTEAAGRFADAIECWDDPGLARHGREGVYRLMHRGVCLELTGRADEARQAYAAAVKEWGAEVWPGPLLRHLAGERPLQDLVAMNEALPSPALKADRLCEINFYAGAQALARGRRDEAVAFFRKAIDTRSTVSREWREAQAFLRRCAPAASPEPARPATP